MSGIDEAAGGVLSARSISSTKNATNIFIPEIINHQQQCVLADSRVITLLI